jgi:hypothetical protein
MFHPVHHSTMNEASHHSTMNEASHHSTTNGAVHHATTNGAVMSLIPEIASYPAQPQYEQPRYEQPQYEYDQPRYDEPRYELGYSNGMHSVPSIASSRPVFQSAPVGVRPMNHHPAPTQWHQPIMTAMEPIDQYVRDSYSSFPVCHSKLF